MKKEQKNRGSRMVERWESGCSTEGGVGAGSTSCTAGGEIVSERYGEATGYANEKARILISKRKEDLPWKSRLIFAIFAWITGSEVLSRSKSGARGDEVDRNRRRGGRANARTGKLKRRSATRPIPRPRSRIHVPG